MLAIAKFLPLLNLKDKRLEDITEEELGQVAGILGIRVDINEELKKAGMALLKGDKIDTVADMIKSPESIQKIMLFLQGKSAETAAIEGELAELYSGDALDSALDVAHQTGFASAESSVVRQPSGLIGSSSVGWRLPS